MKPYKIVLLVIAGVAVLAVVLVISGIYGAEHYTTQPEFCGSCHMMKSYYNSWKNSGHGDKKIACTVCHYPPEEARNDYLQFKGLGQLFTYFYLDGHETRMPTRVDDASCSVPACHPRLKKKVALTKTVSLNHDKHTAMTFEGQKLHCSVCHHNSHSEKHFEVTSDVCYFCHFINKKFNEGLARCSLCHEIPADPLQPHKKRFKGSWWQEDSHDDNRITHRSLEEAQVPCQSCHYQVVRGNGEVNQLRCAACHSNARNNEVRTGNKILKKTDHATGQHVSGQYAECTDCHEPVQHSEIEFLDPVVEGCYVCHPNHHKYQKLLLSGEKGEDTALIPRLMYDAKTNCIGCHLEEKLIKGEKVLRGSTKSCVACHTERHETMVEEWKRKTEKELLHARALEGKAQQAMKDASGRVSGWKLEKAAALLRLGQQNMNIVAYGGGVHNKRYALILLDTAMNDFEEVVDLLND